MSIAVPTVAIDAEEEGVRSSLPPPGGFSLVLCDINPAMCAAWSKAFAAVASPSHPVEIREGDFRKVPSFDCLVSPANSFGLMDGGVDYYISAFFGGPREFVPRVQRALLEEYCGMQPEGTSLIIATGNEKHPFLAHTPTMRLPKSVKGSEIVHQCMLSMLIAVRNHNRRCNPDQRIRTVLCPGLGTGTGGMPYTTAARQMALAYKHFVRNPADDERSALEAEKGGSDGYVLSWEWATSRSKEIEASREVKDCSKDGGSERPVGFSSRLWNTLGISALVVSLACYSLYGG